MMYFCNIIFLKSHFLNFTLTRSPPCVANETCQLPDVLPAAKSAVDERGAASAISLAGNQECPPSPPPRPS